MVSIFNNINRKGQLSVEFLLILLIILVLIEVIIIPLRDYSRDSIEDMININTLDKGLEELKSKYDLLKSYNDGKFELEINLPKDSNFYCNNNKIKYSYKLISQNEDYDSFVSNLSNCKDFICSKESHIPCSFTNKSALENKLNFKLIVSKEVVSDAS